jgi:hypothetical protein
MSHTYSLCWYIVNGWRWRGRPTRLLWVWGQVVVDGDQPCALFSAPSCAVHRFNMHEPGADVAYAELRTRIIGTCATWSSSLWTAKIDVCCSVYMRWRELTIMGRVFCQVQMPLEHV